MLVRRNWSVRGRVAGVLALSAGVAAGGLAAVLGGAKLGLWPWPEPSNGTGVVLGFLLLAIVLFEMALVLRKWLRGGPRKLLRAGGRRDAYSRTVPRRFQARRLFGRARWWLWAHVVVGLVGLPAAAAHAGFGFGGPLTAVTLALFLLVIASGVWGLVLQQWLPEKLLADIPGETVASQADRAMRVYAGAGPGDRTGAAFRLVEELVTVPAETAEEVSATHEPAVTGPAAVDLQKFRDEVLLPYLWAGRRSRSPLRARAEAGRRFARVREAAPPTARPRVDELEAMADLRRRWDQQARIHGWLHNWLLVHLPLSVAMTGLMLVHAARALKYW